MTTAKVKEVGETVVEPVTVDEAKLHLRVDSTDDDIVIETVIQEAREWIEETYSMALITQTLDYYLDEYPESDVMVLPVLSVPCQILPLVEFRFRVYRPVPVHLVRSRQYWAVTVPLAATPA